MGLISSTKRLVCKRIARALASLLVRVGPWRSSDASGGCAVCVVEVAKFCIANAKNTDFGLMVLTALAEEARHKQSHHSRKHRLLVRNMLKQSKHVIAKLLHNLILRHKTEQHVSHNSVIIVVNAPL